MNFKTNLIQGFKIESTIVNHVFGLVSDFDYLPRYGADALICRSDYFNQDSESKTLTCYSSVLTYLKELSAAAITWLTTTDFQYVSDSGTKMTIKVGSNGTHAIVIVTDANTWAYTDPGFVDSGADISCSFNPLLLTFQIVLATSTQNIKVTISSIGHISFLTTGNGSLGSMRECYIKFPTSVTEKVVTDFATQTLEDLRNLNARVTDLESDLSGKFVSR